MPSNITTEHRKILPEPEGPVGGLLNRCRTCRCLGEAPWIASGDIMGIW